MATFTAAAGGSNMLDVVAWPSHPIQTITAVTGTNGSATAVDVSNATDFNPPLTLRYTGSALGWTGTTPNAGTYTSVEIFRGGVSRGVLSGFTAAPFNAITVFAEVLGFPIGANTILDGDDILNGSTASDILFGGYGFSDFEFLTTAGNDTFNGNGGNDTFVVATSGAYDIPGGPPFPLPIVRPAHHFNGVAGSTDTVSVVRNAAGLSSDIVLSSSTFVSIERLIVDGGLGATIASSQIGSGKLAANALINGAASSTLTVIKSAAGLLDLSGISGTIGKIFVTGTALADRIIGTRLADVIDGGQGNDTLSGGIGNDTLLGGAGNDALGGGVGIDVARGGNGNDTYYVDSARDIASETNAVASTGGIDRVISSANRILGANLENLYLSGSQAVLGTGNALKNFIAGSSANNVLSGRGGNDTLTGGLGADQFVFDTAPNTTSNRDAITDYHAAADTIRLENSVFSALGARTGFLTAEKFFAGTAAHDANDRVVYNAATGALLYDADGSGAGAAVHFATLTNRPAVTHLDFLVI